jgi:hypothetical protein
LCKNEVRARCGSLRRGARQRARARQRKLCCARQRALARSSARAGGSTGLGVAPQGHGQRTDAFARTSTPHTSGWHSFDSE